MGKVKLFIIAILIAIIAFGIWIFLLGILLFPGANLHDGVSLWKDAGCFAGFKIHSC